MVEHRSRFRSQDPDFEVYGEDITGRTRSGGGRSYAFGRTARQDYGDEESTPLFLSDSEDEYMTDQDDEPDRWEAGHVLRKKKSSVSLKILMGVLAASAVAMLFALFTSDAMRDAIDSAKASFATVLPVPSANAQSDATQLTARDIQLKDPTRLGAPAAGRATTAQGPNVQTQVAMVAPSREDISNAYQSALQRAPVVAPPAAPPVAAMPPAAPPVATAPPVAAPQPVVAAPPITAAVAPVATPVTPPVTGPAVLPSPFPSPAARRIDPDELAMLMNRARSLLASGDIPPARLLLERAADGQDAGAAFLLAQTYDPDVLGARDARTITPDPAAARAWYQKAAQLGSADAQRRLAQMQN
jgi:hypothetical protein